MKRQRQAQIQKDLAKKMVFLVGPRQVGKTWLSRTIAKEYSHPQYLNYDHLESRLIIQKEAWPNDTDLLILDEIHKMPQWKNYLKGLFDTKPESMHILVTGSARLDTFRQAGDSLAGRFFLHRLMPFSLSELAAIHETVLLDTLIVRSGFPEPFLAESDEDATRWRAAYIDGLIRTDILDFETIHHLKSMQTIFELLRRRVGSPLSLRSLAEDVQISVPTASRYVDILEKLYIIFKVTPYSRNIARSILREPKIYFYDTGLVLGDPGILLKNAVAVSLLTHCFFKSDTTGKEHWLCYIRNKEGKEIDFALTDRDDVHQLIEVKLSDKTISHALRYFSEDLNVPGIQLVKDLRQEKQEGNIHVVNAGQWLEDLS